LLVLALVGASLLLYTLHYLLFRDAYHITYYLLSSIAFLPIEALLAVFVLNRLLESRDKQTRMEKLNMVIGAFFSETGTRLLTWFSERDPRLGELRNELVMDSDWTLKRFDEIALRLKSYPCSITFQKDDLVSLKVFLVQQREFLLRLLENPTLLEHESFTELLMAVFHLTEELAAREEVSAPAPADARHITGDMERAYRLLVAQWLAYMRHLITHYPYLFSLALRTNPFDRNASVELY
jgi:hypothetical protein